MRFLHGLLDRRQLLVGGVLGGLLAEQLARDQLLLERLRDLRIGLRAALGDGAVELRLRDLGAVDEGDDARRQCIRRGR